MDTDIFGKLKDMSLFTLSFRMLDYVENLKKKFKLRYNLDRSPIQTFKVFIQKFGLQSSVWNEVLQKQ